MKLLKETLFDRIRNRLAPPNAVKVIKNLKRASGRAELSYMEIKEASQYVERYKIEAKAAMKAWRSWNTRAAVSELVGALRLQEGRILRSDAVAKASLYLDAQRDYRDLVNLAMGQARPPANDPGGRS